MKFWMVFYYFLIICVGLPCISFYFKRVFFCFILNFYLIPIFIRKIYALTFNYIQTQGGLEH